MKAVKTGVDLGNAYKLSYPRQLVLVTSHYQEKDNVMTVAWESPLSFDPPLHGILVSPKRFSHDMILKSGDFGLNFMDTDSRRAVKICGSMSGKDKDKFGITGLTREKAKRIKAPLIGEAICQLECKVIDYVETGDHTLFIGKVLAARAREGFLSDPLKFKKICQIAGNRFTGLEGAEFEV